MPSAKRGFCRFDITANDDPESYLRYSENDDGSHVLVGTENAGVDLFKGKLTVPATHKDRPVTAIGAFAFSNRTDILEGELPPGIRSIGRGAFSNCTGIASLALSEGLTNLEDNCFCGLNVKTLVVPASVVSLGTLNLPNLEVLRFFGKPRHIADPLGVPSTCHIYWPANSGWEDIVENVSGTWQGCDADYWVDFTWTVRDDGSVAVAGYKSPLVEGYLEIPEKFDGRPVTAIADEAFKDRPEIRTVVLPSGLVELGNQAFCGCTGLTEVEIPTHVESVGAWAFGTPDELSRITKVIFRGVPPLTGGDVYLDSAVCVVEVGAEISSWQGISTWQGCPVRRIFAYETTPNADGSCTLVAAKPGEDGVLVIPSEVDGRVIRAVTNSKMTEETKLKIREVRIPDSVETLGTNAFSDCKNLVKVEMGAGLLTIGETCFLNCTQLAEVTLPANLHTIGAGAFMGCFALSALRFNGNAPDVTLMGDEKDGYLANVFYPSTLWRSLLKDRYDCTIYAKPGTTGWGATWQDCPVVSW